jgi:hypothetical protein
MEMRRRKDVNPKYHPKCRKWGRLDGFTEIPLVEILEHPQLMPKSVDTVGSIGTVSMFHVVVSAKIICRTTPYASERAVSGY